MSTNLVADKLGERVNGAFGPTDLAEQNDAALVAAAAAGAGDQAFEILVRRHQARIQRVAWRFTRNREDAEDIAQQAFQKAFVHLRQFEGNSSFSTWLTRIAINEALMWTRRKRSSPEMSLEAPTMGNELAPMLNPPDTALNPEEACVELERKRIVSAAIGRLTPKVRTAVQLRQIGELSIQEMAEVMDLSVGAVKARLFHGRRKLRSMLKRYVGSTPRSGKRAVRAIPRTNNVAPTGLVGAFE